MRRFVASPSVRKTQNADYFDPVYIGILFLRNVLSTAHVHMMSTKETGSVHLRFNFRLSCDM